MDWFERLMGFREGAYAETQSRLRVEGDRLHSTVNGRSFCVGTFEMLSWVELRRRASVAPRSAGRLHAAIAHGDVRRLHQAPGFEGALFQVAS
jgi:hypothetical protein